MTKSILEYWPTDKFPPREAQREALLWLEQQTSKYLFLDAPVGTGKSLIGITYGRWLDDGKGDSFILVPQKILQKQYEDEDIIDKKSLFSLYGKSNYKCSRYASNCAVGSAFKKCTSCPHKAAKVSATNKDNVIMNYTLALLNLNFTDTFEPRKLIIADEAHNLETHLVDFGSVSISRVYVESLKMKMKQYSNATEAFNWIANTYLPKLELKAEADDIRISGILKQKKISKKDKDDIKSFKTLENTISSLSNFVEFSSDIYDTEYVLISDNKKLEFKPLYGKRNFHEMLSKHAEQFLFMSGTMNSKRLCIDLGIPEEETATLSLDSNFHKDNRPVIYIPGTKMNVSWDKPESATGLKKYLRILDQILDLYDGDSGVIHTGNFKISEFLVDHIQKRNDFKVFHHNPESGNDRSEVIAEFSRDTKSSILISPSITEGLDLKHEKGRFGIIAKLPYGYLGDPWVKRRLELSPVWYNTNLSKDIIQACGRIVRSEDDYGSSYIIDQSWAWFYEQNSHLFPKWWRNGYIHM